MRHKFVETRILKEYIAAEHFEDYEQEHFERCPCGSSVFRIYNEPVKEGTYEQMVCAICNHRIGGWLNDWKKDGNVDGRICRKCGDDLKKAR